MKHEKRVAIDSAIQRAGKLNQCQAGRVLSEPGLAQCSVNSNSSYGSLRGDALLEHSFLRPDVK